MSHLFLVIIQLDKLWKIVSTQTENVFKVFFLPKGRMGTDLLYTFKSLLFSVNHGLKNSFKKRKHLTNKDWKMDVVFNSPQKMLYTISCLKCLNDISLQGHKFSALKA